MRLILLASLLLPIFAQQAPGVSTHLYASLERLARLVDISYCVGNTGIREPFECLSRCAEFPNVTLVKTWRNGFFMADTCGYIAVDDTPTSPAAPDSHESIIVAFRGTYSITDTIIDLSTVPQEYIPYTSSGRGPSHKCANCTVHKGFFDAWEGAKDSVLPKLLDLRDKYPSKPIHLVGHSMGGAVACLAGLELKTKLGLDNVVVTTFGEPRVGNAGLTDFINAIFGIDGEAASLERAYRRVTHTDDPVPLLPPGEWGYKSHAGEVYIAKSALPPSKQNLQLCMGNDDKNCSAGQDSVSQNPVHLTEVYGGLATGELQKQGLPTRLKLWQLFFAHRDYFWRLGLCFPGGDPADWGRAKPESSQETDANYLEL